MKPKLVVKSCCWNLMVLWLICSHSLFAQTLLKGIVTDNTHQAVPFANVTVHLPDSSSILAFASTDETGHYRLQLDAPGHFSVKASSLGFQTAVLSIQVDEHQAQQVLTHDFVLAPADYQLREITVTSKSPPIIFKKDTIVFNAASFSDGTERVVEDLLRKLPGVDVAEDGGISVNGKGVETVMIEGDDLFEKGYSMLTKNLSAGMVDNVEVLQNYSKNPLLKEVRDDKKVALNLTLDEERKAVLFGDADLGYGTNSFYDARVNLISFIGKTKLYSLTNLNNVGDDPTGDAAALYFNGDASQAAGGNLGQGEQASYLIDLVAQKPEVSEERGNFNNAEFSTLNFVNSFNDQFKLKGQLSFSSDENNFFRQSLTAYRLPDDPFSVEEHYALRKKSSSGFIRLDATYDLTDNTRLEYRGNYRRNRQRTRTSLLSNANPVEEGLHSDLTNMDNQISVTRKLGKGQVLLLNGRYIYDKRPQDYRANQFLFQDLFPGLATAAGIRQYNVFAMEFGGGQAEFIQNRKKTNLNLKLSWTNRKDELFSRFLIDTSGVLIQAGGRYQNATNYQQGRLTAEAKLKYRLSDKIALSPQFKAHAMSAKLTDDPNNEEALLADRYRGIYTESGLGINWEKDRDNELLLKYTYKTSFSATQELYPSYILNDYRSFSRGLGQIEPLRSSYFLLSYTHGSWAKNFLANGSLMYSLSHDYLGNTALITPLYTQNSKVLLHNRHFLNARLSVDRFIEKLSSNVKVSSTFSRSGYQNIVNQGALRQIRVNNFQLGLELRSVFTGVFNFHTGTEWKWLTYQNEQQSTNTINNSFFDLTLNISRKVLLQLHNDLYYFSNLDKGNNIYSFSDLELIINTKRDGLNFKVSAQNLFNVDLFTEASLDDLLVSQATYRLLPRYVLVSVNFPF